MKPNSRPAVAGFLTSVLGCALLSAALLPFTLTASQALEPPSDGRALLAQMTAQGHLLNYDGTFVYIRGTSVGSMRIIHKAGTNGGRERLISLSGSAKEVVRDGDEVTCFFPGERSVMVDRSGPGKLLTGRFSSGSQDKISEQYQYTVLGGDRIVGRPTWVVKIAPKIPDRYAYQVWLDSSSSLLLKSEVLGLSSEILEQILFTTIEFPRDIPESLLRPAADGRGYKWYKNDAPQPTKAPGPNPIGEWRVQWLPDGFSIQDHRFHAMHESNDPVDHMVFSDGLAALSVFVEKARDGQPVLDGLSNLGAVNSFGTKLGGFQITVVGELPPDTVKRVAASVVQTEAAAAAEAGGPK